MPESGFEVQLAAMRAVMEALTPLDEKDRESVLAWVDSQFGRAHNRSISTHQKDLSSRQQRDSGNQSVQQREGTVSHVAQKLEAKSARDLLLAAAIHISLFQGKEKFSRAELIACAKEARGWRAEYTNQMGINIKRMQGAGTLFEKSSNIFSLSDGALKDAEAKL